MKRNLRARSCRPPGPEQVGVRHSQPPDCKDKCESVLDKASSTEVGAAPGGLRRPQAAGVTWPRGSGPGSSARRPAEPAGATVSSASTPHGEAQCCALNPREGRRLPPSSPCADEASGLPLPSLAAGTTCTGCCRVFPVALPSLFSGVGCSAAGPRARHSRVRHGGRSQSTCCPFSWSLGALSDASRGTDVRWRPHRAP